MDFGEEAPMGRAVAVNLLLLGLFGLQHSGMARQGFKKRWTAIIPEHLERSTYVLVSSLTLFLLFWQWRPISGMVWNLQDSFPGTLLWGCFWFGWLMVFVSSFLINHFDLFGLRQVYLHLRSRPYTPLEFNTPALYRYVRHPIMLGFLIAFWSTPRMTIGHLIFSIGATLYILIGIRLEERDLVDLHGEAYEDYRRRASMLQPLPMKRREP